MLSVKVCIVTGSTVSCFLCHVQTEPLSSTRLSCVLLSGMESPTVRWTTTPCLASSVRTAKSTSPGKSWRYNSTRLFVSFMPCSQHGATSEPTGFFVTRGETLPQYGLCWSGVFIREQILQITPTCGHTVCCSDLACYY